MRGFIVMAMFVVSLSHAGSHEYSEVRNLDLEAAGLSEIFIDAGAGNGDVTRAFAGTFDRTIAIEPNTHLLTQLQRAVPQAEAIGTSILTTSPKAQGDFVLCKDGRVLVFPVSRPMTCS